MVCEKCGYVLGPFDTTCAKCEQMRAHKHTKRLPDLRSMQTQHLVQLDPCVHCKFLLFPGDNQCPSCGMPVHRPWRRSAPSKQPSIQRQRQPSLLMLGLVVGAIVIGIVVICFCYHLLTA